MKPYFDLFHTVAADEIDAQQHVHNLRYLQWTLWAAGKHSAACGWDGEAALARGLGWVVRKHDATYRAAAVAGDEIAIRTWVAETAKYAARRKYVVCRPADKTVLARVETRWVYVDLNEHKVVAIPSELQSQMIVTDRIPPLPWESENA
ncbi:MAG: acyl-CoA thioesterase [Pirellulaceae bacterium]